MTACCPISSKPARPNWRSNTCAWPSPVCRGRATWGSPRPLATSSPSPTMIAGMRLIWSSRFKRLSDSIRPGTRWWRSGSSRPRVWRDQRRAGKPCQPQPGGSFGVARPARSACLRGHRHCSATVVLTSVWAWASGLVPVRRPTCCCVCCAGARWWANGPAPGCTTGLCCRPWPDRRPSGAACCTAPAAPGRSTPSTACRAGFFCAGCCPRWPRRCGSARGCANPPKLRYFS